MFSQAAMATRILPIEDPTALTRALQCLATDNALVAPTDTVYGLMCRFDRPQAIDKLYEIKGRPPEKAIPVLISELTQLTQLTPVPVSPIVKALADRFWPGPLTIVLPALATLPAILTAHQPTVGVRLPAHDWLRRLIYQSGPLAATSANLSGQPEAQTVAAVLAQLAGRIELVLADANLDQRVAAESVASTVVAVDGHQAFQILRAGPIAGQVRCFLQEQLPNHVDRH
jgi:L-threonylcarbamoyladenylate synthase